MSAGDDDEPIDLVTTVEGLDPVVETLKDVLHRSGAVRVAAAVDLADHDEPAIVDVGQLLPIEVQVGAKRVHLPHAIELDAEPLAQIEVRQLPPFDVDVLSGEVTGTIGGLQHVADAARALAAALGGRSVALISLRTTTPDLLLTLTARPGDPVVVTVGDEEFELPEPGEG